MSGGVASQAAESPTIRRWLDGLRDQSGITAGIDDPRVQLVAGFCQSSGRSPEEVVEYCFLVRKATGQRFLSVERRKELGQQIDEYVRGLGHAGHQFVATANTLRSFLIHNGVFIGAARMPRD